MAPGHQLPKWSGLDSVWHQSKWTPAAEILYLGLFIAFQRGGSFSLVSVYTCCMLLGAFYIPAEAASPGNLCHSMSSAPCLCSQLTSVVWQTMSSGYIQSKFGGEFLARALPLRFPQMSWKGRSLYKSPGVVFQSQGFWSRDQSLLYCSDYTPLAFKGWIFLCVLKNEQAGEIQQFLFFFEKTFHVSYKLKYKNKYIPIQKPKQQQQTDLHIITFPVNTLVSFLSLSFWLTRLSQIFF